MNLKDFETQIATEIRQIASDDDPAHDFLHFQRVVATAKRLAQIEKADPWIVVPAAWLHDYVIVPKSSPLRNQASQLSAQKAAEFLGSIGYPTQYLSGIQHAIAAHSFSAKINAETREAQVVQDADRLDGLGAIGIARCFATAGLLKRPFYSQQDPFCETRPPDDLKFTLDHFEAKLFRVAETLHTESAKAEGKKRVHEMRAFLNAMRSEILSPNETT